MDLLRKVAGEQQAAIMAQRAPMYIGAQPSGSMKYASLNVYRLFAASPDLRWFEAKPRAKHDPVGRESARTLDAPLPWLLHLGFCWLVK